MKKSLPVLVLTAVTALTLTGCTGSNSTQPTTGPSTPAPTVSSDPNKYTFQASDGPDTQFGLQLLQRTTYVDQPLKNGVLNETYGNCGVVFVDRRTITADHLLSTDEQLKQSDNWIKEYAKQVGSTPTAIENGSLASTEQQVGGGGTYNIQTREAKFESSRYNGVLESRVFPDGTGLALAVLCRTGVTVPDLKNVRITTKALPAPVFTPSASPSVTDGTVSPLPTPSTGQ